MNIFYIKKVVAIIMLIIIGIGFDFKCYSYFIIKFNINPYFAIINIYRINSKKKIKHVWYCYDRRNIYYKILNPKVLETFKTILIENDSELYNELQLIVNKYEYYNNYINKHLNGYHRDDFKRDKFSSIRDECENKIKDISYNILVKNKD